MPAARAAATSRSRVADINTVGGRDPELCGGVQQWRRVRLVLRSGVAADDHVGARGQRKVLEHRQGEARGLVGDDTPGKLAALDLGQHARGVGEELRVHGERGGVVGEKGVLQRFPVRIVVRDAEPGAEHAAGAIGCMRTQRGDGQRRQAAIGAHAVERGGEISGGVGERAVEIEQHRAHAQHARAGLSRVLRGRGERSQCN